MRRRLIALITAGFAVLAGPAFAPAAGAAEADGDIVLVTDRVTPELPGLTVTAQVVGGTPRLVVRNPTATPVTALSASGEPFVRIGPDGVFGNVRSPEWFATKAVDGPIPATAVEHGRPSWLRVAEYPSWGWFDQRLRGLVVPDAAARPLDHLAAWSVPILQGELPGTIEGHVEYRPLRGALATAVAERQPAPGVTVDVARGRPPTVTLDYAGTGSVVVLGTAGEPYLRITARGAESNWDSPTRALAADPVALPGPVDPAAPPRWTPVAPNPRAVFALPAAEPVPDAAYYAATEPTVVANWVVPLAVDGKRIDVPGTTTLTPPGYVEPRWHHWQLPAVIAFEALLIVVLSVWIARRVARNRRQRLLRAAPVEEREVEGAGL